MKTKFALVLLSAVLLLTSCQINGRLYPVQGPLSSQTPPPIFAAKATGAFNSGSVTVKLADGERCQGPWKMVERGPSRYADRAVKSDATASQQPTNLSAAWDTVYGQGFYTAHILGTKLHVWGTLQGDKGTILNIELFRSERPDGPSEIRGVAKDNKGNLYKVVF